MRCKFCNRELKNLESIRNRCGAFCARKYGVWKEQIGEQLGLFSKIKKTENESKSSKKGV